MKYRIQHIIPAKEVAILESKRLLAKTIKGLKHEMLLTAITAQEHLLDGKYTFTWDLVEWRDFELRVEYIPRRHKQIRDIQIKLKIEKIDASEPHV